MKQSMETTKLCFVWYVYVFISYLISHTLIVYKLRQLLLQLNVDIDVIDFKIIILNLGLTVHVDKDTAT